MAIDFRDRPFSKLRLLYDLYDYNDYRDETGVEVDEPTNDPYDKGYIVVDFVWSTTQHLKLVRQIQNVMRLEKVSLLYAKVLDSGLYKRSDDEDDTSEFVAITPSHPQLDVDGVGYSSSSIETREKRCLPDSFSYTELSTSLSESITTMSVEMAVTLDDSNGNSENYFFNGPFRGIGEDTWEIISASSGTSSAIFFPPPAVDSENYDDYPAGIFQYNGNSTSPYDPQTGFGSFLFPRRGIMDIGSEVEHLSSSTTWGEVSNESLIISGETESMYGCNIRVSNYDKYSNEGISSCNISATIEIIATVDGEELSLMRQTT